MTNIAPLVHELLLRLEIGFPLVLLAVLLFMWAGRRFR